MSRKLNTERDLLARGGARVKTCASECTSHLLVYWAAPATTLPQHLLAVPLAPRAPGQSLNLGLVFVHGHVSCHVSVNTRSGVRCGLSRRGPLCSTRRRREQASTQRVQCSFAPRKGCAIVRECASRSPLTRTASDRAARSFAAPPSVATIAMGAAARRARARACCSNVRDPPSTCLCGFCHLSPLSRLTSLHVVTPPSGQSALSSPAEEICSLRAK